jgi:uncharacterized protein
MTKAKAEVLRSLETLTFANLLPKPTAINGSEPKDATDNALELKASNVSLGFGNALPAASKQRVRVSTK